MRVSLRTRSSFVTLGGVTAALDGVDPSLILWRRSERSVFRALLRYYEHAGSKQEHDRELVSTVVESGRTRVGDLLPPAPKRLSVARNAFGEELRRLIGLFTALSGTPTVRVRIEIERGNRCRYFHTDRIGLRLLCTYLGPGTQWVPDAFADRSALRSGDNTAIVPDPDRVERLAPFWIGLFKGDLHPDCPGRGCIHRSPSIESRRNAARILLTIDNPTDD